MPVNPGIEYQRAEQRSIEAKTPQEKLKALEEMLSLVPKHKSSEKLVKLIRHRIAKLKKQLEKERDVKGKRFQISVKKEGAAQIVLVGVTSVGKSSLLNRLTNYHAKIGEYEFTTKLPEVGTLEYNGIKLQLVEMPAIREYYLSKDKGPLFFSIMRNADLVVFVLTKKEQLKFLLNEFDRANIRFNEEQPLKETVIKYMPAVVVFNGEERVYFDHFHSFSLDFLKGDLGHLKKFLWDHLGLIYVSTKAPGKKPNFPPIALKKGAKVEDLALHIHKDFIRKFKYARVFGKSAKFEKGQQVGLQHELREGDVVELHLK